MLTLCTRGDYMVELVKKYKIIIVALILIIANFLFISHKNQENYQETIVFQQEELVPVQDNDLNEVEHTTLEVDTLEIPVFICGAVAKPDVYFVTKDCIVQDVLNLAGGFLETADSKAVNLAKQVTANEQIYIPEIGEVIEAKPAYENQSIESSQESKWININTATAEQLEKLPGIGEVKAQQIVTHRLQNGLFQSKEAIKDVSGIGDKTYSALQEWITIE